MKKIVVFSLVGLVFLGSLSFYLFYYRPILNSQYQTDKCFKDTQLQVIFKVLKVKPQSYVLEVVHSGHYSASPEYAVGTQLEYSKVAVDQNQLYHPSLCEVKE